MLLGLVTAVAACVGCGAAQPAAGPRAHAPAAPLSARIVLPSRTMTAGSQMAGHVVVDNNTGHAIYAPTCRGLFTVTLSNGTYHPAVTTPSIACRPTRAIPAGESSYPVKVVAAYLACSVGHSGGGFKACLPGMKPPPLSPGSYQATLSQPGKVVPDPPAIAVRVTSPATG